MTTHQIGTLEDFPERMGTRVVVDGIEVAVFNLDGKLYGIQNLCPHKRLPLHLAGQPRYYSPELLAEGFHDIPEEKKRPDEDIRGGFDDEALTVKCPWHHLEWSLVTGENPMKRVRLPTYDIEEHDDGTVWIEI